MKERITIYKKTDDGKYMSYRMTETDTDVLRYYASNIHILNSIEFKQSIHLISPKWKPCKIKIRGLEPLFTIDLVKLHLVFSGCQDENILIKEDDKYMELM